MRSVFFFLSASFVPSTGSPTLCDARPSKDMPETVSDFAFGVPNRGRCVYAVHRYRAYRFCQTSTKNNRVRTHAHVYICMCIFRTQQRARRTHARGCTKVTRQFVSCKIFHLSFFAINACDAGPYTCDILAQRTRACKLYKTLFVS